MTAIAKETPLDNGPTARYHYFRMSDFIGDTDFSRAGALVVSIVALVLATLLLAATADAYKLSSSCFAVSKENNWCLRNGAHNWTQAETQLWGSTESGGSGYSARLGIAMIDNGITHELGKVVSTNYFLPQKKGSGSGQYDWNFGRQFASSYPIREGVEQLNAEEAQQWVWAWAYGP